MARLGLAVALTALLVGCGNGAQKHESSLSASSVSTTSRATEIHSLSPAQVDNLRENLIASAKLDFGGGEVQASSFEGCFLSAYARRLTPSSLRRLVNLEISPGIANAYPPLTDISERATRVCGYERRQAPALFSAESQLPWALVRSVAAPPCDPEDMKLELGRGSPTTGGVLVGLRLTNAGRRVCRLTDELSYKIVAPDRSPVSIEGNGWTATPGTLSLPSRTRELQVNWHWLNWCGDPRRLLAVSSYGPVEVSHTTLTPLCQEPDYQSGMGPAGIEQY
jgi:hypothetical protein